MPTVSPTAPQREVRIGPVGLDDKSLVGSVPRIVTFEIDGQSLLHAAVSNATGGVQLCVWREAVNDERVCQTGRNIALDRAVLDTGSGLWHVSMLGAKGVAPTAALTVDFNANAPSVQFDNFRFYGTSNPPYNGFTAGIDTGAGELSLQGNFDDGQSGHYDYHWIVQPNGGDAIEGTGQSMTSFVADDPRLKAIDPNSYSITVQNPDEVANPGVPVFLTATIGWP